MIIIVSLYSGSGIIDTMQDNHPKIIHSICLTEEWKTALKMPSAGIMYLLTAL